MSIRPPADADPEAVDIYVRQPMTDRTYIGWLYIRDVYKKNNAQRVAVPIRNVEEVKRIIKELEKMLPVVERLADLAGD